MTGAFAERAAREAACCEAIHVRAPASNAAASGFEAAWDAISKSRGQGVSKRLGTRIGGGGCPTNLF